MTDNTSTPLSIDKDFENVLTWRKVTEIDLGTGFEAITAYQLGPNGDAFYNVDGETLLIKVGPNGAYGPYSLNEVAGHELNGEPLEVHGVSKAHSSGIVEYSCRKAARVIRFK